VAQTSVSNSNKVRRRACIIMKFGNGVESYYLVSQLLCQLLPSGQNRRSVGVYFWQYGTLFWVPD